MNPGLIFAVGAVTGCCLGFVLAAMLAGAKQADAHLERRHRVCRDCGQPGDLWDKSCLVCGGRVEVEA